MPKRNWVRVSASTPCPVCKKSDWCRLSADGTLAVCRRVQEGCFRSKEDRAGAPYFLHRLSDNRLTNAAPAQPSGPDAKGTGPDTLHEVYSALMSKMPLSKAHREALRDRGLPDEAIDRYGYGTLPVRGRARIAKSLQEQFGEKLMRVPGFVVTDGASGRYMTLRGPAGLVVPCRDLAGRVVALKVRRDDAGHGGPRYVYCSSAGHGGPGPGSPAHVPLGTPKEAELVRLIEGELKADLVQARTALPTVSAPGVTNWRGTLPVLHEMGCKTARLAFDADSHTNPVVARALSSCAEALAEAGFAVELERWDAADGKGLDDLLMSGKEPELLQGEAARRAIREILATATSEEDPSPPDELARLQDVLDAGGAAALFRDKSLLQALANLQASDTAAFAEVRASVRGLVSLRDLDRALRSLRPSKLSDPGEGASLYFEESGCLWRNVRTKDRLVSIRLCNFTVRILEDVVHDDGAEQSRYLAVEGTLADGSPLPRAEVSAADFPAMGWVMSVWGPRAVIAAGMGIKDHLRAAIQERSGDVRRRTV